MLRKCVGCNKLLERNQLIRMTKDHKNGKIIINPDSKTFGRSAYLCYNQSCIETALKKNKLNRVLKTSEDLKGILDGQYKS